MAPRHETAGQRPDRHCIDEQGEMSLNEIVKSVLDARLNASPSRRRFLQGTGGLVALTVLGASPQSFAAELGGDLNYFGWDGEHGANVAKYDEVEAMVVALGTNQHRLL